MDTDTLKRWNPSPEPLLQLVIDHNDESMLREIADADYRQDSEEHYVAIVHLIKTRDFTTRMEWCPSEVLELIRWSEPEDPTWKPGSTGMRGHWMRLFACTFLLRSAAEPANRDYLPGEDSTLIRLVTSALALGKVTALATLQFLCWRLQIDKAEGESPYVALGVLLLAISLRDYDRERLELLMHNITDDWLFSPFPLLCISGDSWRTSLESIVLNSPLNDIDIVKERVEDLLTC